MKATIVDSIEDATEPGSIEIRYAPDDSNEPAGIAISCAGCGSHSWLPTHSESRGWKIESLNPVTISPSVLHSVERGGCGWHGYLRNGEWVSC